MSKKITGSPNRLSGGGEDGREVSRGEENRTQHCGYSGVIGAGQSVENILNICATRVMEFADKTISMSGLRGQSSYPEWAVAALL